MSEYLEFGSANKTWSRRAPQRPYCVVHTREESRANVEAKVRAELAYLRQRLDRQEERLLAAWRRQFRREPLFQVVGSGRCAPGPMQIPMPFLTYCFGLFVVAAMISMHNDEARSWKGCAANWEAQDQWSRGQVLLFVAVALAGFFAWALYLGSEHNKQRLARIREREAASAYRGRGLTAMQRANGLWRDERGRIRS